MGGMYTKDCYVRMGVFGCCFNPSFLSLVSFWKNYNAICCHETLAASITSTYYRKHILDEKLERGEQDTRDNAVRKGNNNTDMVNITRERHKVLTDCETHGRKEENQRLKLEQFDYCQPTV
eukprot:TRINITY_DN22987_c0_g1_i1.p1 TRINITY_DN22987_c0_g1~~TRINITY_DN22987_c0_g1_i1.p1  ORF type:complete len:121 (-),score=10.20 TRINITY_DN22987_c0_g1_i1:527-889(-)